jgi:hypothetical protein
LSFDFVNVTVCVTVDVFVLVSLTVSVTVEGYDLGTTVRVWFAPPVCKIFILI